MSVCSRAISSLPLEMRVTSSRSSISVSSARTLRGSARPCRARPGAARCCARARAAPSRPASAACAARARGWRGSGPWRGSRPRPRRAPSAVVDQRLRPARRGCVSSACSAARACGLVAQDLEQADRLAAVGVAHRHHHAAAPEAAAVLAPVPALVGGAAVGERRLPLRARARRQTRSSSTKMMSPLWPMTSGAASRSASRRRCSSS